jgi:hypothetical protein
MAHRIETESIIPHGVVFLYDPTTLQIDVPPDTGAAPVLATSDCISLWTLQEDDGPVTLVLGDAYEDTDCRLVYQGRIATKGHELAFHTSAFEPLLQLASTDDLTTVAIYTNGERDPSKLVCVVGTTAK